MRLIALAVILGRLRGARIQIMQPALGALNEAKLPRLAQHAVASRQHFLIAARLA
jgi:hypothetical protein